MKARGNAHPLASMFPRIEGQEFIELVNSIKKNGLLEPIMLDKEGRVLDGINRLEACIAAKVEPIFAIYEGDDVASFILARNVARRHLSASQRALFAARLQKIAAAENAGQEWSISAIARSANVSRRTAKQALEIIEKGDEDAAEKVSTGNASVFSIAKQKQRSTFDDESIIEQDPKAAKEAALSEMQVAIDALLEENKRLESLVDPDIERKLRSYEETIERQQQEIIALKERVAILTRENKKLKEALDSFA
ncbi:MAG: ParB/RepB/Spo0J family partition protein [Casimicrobiaceae bacterium]